ncbi:hypothetical protein WKW77_33370 [Variovorax ureilyticus]|uniref:Uncharacterized protein n=1 Tax=Variovorax ureilyticus TaxID=1836198 RepID=A0ABU8VSH8_9BURK
MTTIRISLCACLALLAANALAITRSDDVMADRYADVQHCIERALGRQWKERFDIETTINRWGAVTDLRCRRQLDLAGQPRP